MYRSVATVAVMLMAWSASTALGAANLLVDPSFEAGSGTLFGPAWTTFGTNVYREAVTPNTGTYSAKMYSNFDSVSNLTGIFQDSAAVAGQLWYASIYVRHNTGDLVSGANRALLKLEFLNAGFTTVGFEEIEILNAATGPDTYRYHDVAAYAPAGTSWARITLLFHDDAANSGGAAFFDDAVLSVPEPASLFAALSSALAWSLKRPGRRSRALE